MLLGALSASLLGNLWKGRGINKAGKGKGDGTVRTGYGRPLPSALHNNKMDF